MATAPTPEDTPREILISSKGVRAGEVLMLGHVTVALQETGRFRGQDVTAGIQYGHDHIRRVLGPTGAIPAAGRFLSPATFSWSNRSTACRV